jgi:hypothetical protein
MALQIVKLIDPIQIVLSPGAFSDGVNDGDTVRWNADTSTWDVVAPVDISTPDDGELHLTPKVGSTGAIGTVFFSGDDEHLYVGVTL